MKRPRNWGNCEASKAAIEVWVFGGEQPPKRINCFGEELTPLHFNYTRILRPCRIEFLFSNQLSQNTAQVVQKYCSEGAIIQVLDCGTSVFSHHFEFLEK